MSAEPIDSLPEIHDFDFIHGRWTVANRRLKQWGVGSDDWDEYPSTSNCEPRLDGLANVEQIDCPARGWTGMAVRSFDIPTREWVIHWISSLNGVLQPPVRGRFGADGRPRSSRVSASRRGLTAARQKVYVEGRRHRSDRTVEGPRGA